MVGCPDRPGPKYQIPKENRATRIEGAREWEGGRERKRGEGTMAGEREKECRVIATSSNEDDIRGRGERGRKYRMYSRKKERENEEQEQE